MKLVCKLKQMMHFIFCMRKNRQWIFVIWIYSRGSLTVTHTYTSTSLQHHWYFYVKIQNVEDFLQKLFQVLNVYIQILMVLQAGTCICVRQLTSLYYISKQPFHSANICNNKDSLPVFPDTENKMHYLFQFFWHATVKHNWGKRIIH